jgi:hypothetical protein
VIFASGALTFHLDWTYSGLAAEVLLHALVRRQQPVKAAQARFGSSLASRLYRSSLGRVFAHGIVDTG